MGEVSSRPSGTVAVVIVNYNAGEMLERCLLALSRQTRVPDRVLVVDNASSDRSVEQARPSLTTAEFILSKDNLGFAAANNLAVQRAADCDWIALLNPDAFPEPHWLEGLMTAADQFPQTASFGSLMLAAERHDVVDGSGDAYHISGAAWRRDHLRPLAQAVTEPGFIFAPCAAAALYRRDCYLQAGGFDEDFFCYMEDVDLGFRLRLLGYQSRYVPDAVVYHVGYGTSGKSSDFAVYHGHRNLVWTFVKNMPGALFWLLLPVHLALNVYVLSAFSWRGQGRTIWRSKRDAFLGLRRAWQKRRSIQAQRNLRTASLWPLLAKGMPRP
ncbi:MAG: glycosyltransferase family 2 protein [Chromatiales bacterium]|nr:glycosyltransferase family 2 protein [Chromatiales bacterium]